MNAIAPLAAPTTVAQRDAELRSTFQKAVAGQMFGMMLKSMRTTVGKPAYLHGGQGEELFQSQLDQHIVEQLSESDGSPFVQDLYKQFRVQLGLSPEDAAPLSSPSLQPAASHQLAQLTEAAQQARSAAERTPGTTGTAALSALFRK